MTTSNPKRPRGPAREQRSSDDGRPEGTPREWRDGEDDGLDAEQARIALPAAASQKCGDCFEPATHFQEREAEPYCTACATRNSARDAGHAYSSLAILATAAQVAHIYGGLIEDEIVAAVRAALGNPADYHEPLLPRWALGPFELDTRFVPLTDGEEASR
jgi:hypothetical protein